MSESKRTPLAYTIEQVTPKLRWRDGVLQQAFTVTTYERAIPKKQEVEWRNVPTAESDI